MSTNSILILTDRQMRGLIAWPDALRASEAAYCHYSAGRANSPNRTRLALRDGRRFAVMPAVDLDADALGVKLVGYYPDNPAQGLPRVTGSYVLIDPNTGLPLALMDGAYLTNLRTAAGGVVAARTLARPGWRRLGIIGSGALATMSAQAFLAADAPASIALYSRTPAHLARFAESLARDTTAQVHACTTPEELVRASEVILCATDTHAPLFDGAALHDGQLVISIGANTPTTRELDARTMTAGEIFCDSRSAVSTECGEIIIAQQEGRLPATPALTELGAVLNGASPGRRTDSETLVFLSTGLAVQDALTARMIVDRARQLQVGSSVRLIDRTDE